jgi:uncharacterized membrane protein
VFVEVRGVWGDSGSGAPARPSLRVGKLIRASPVGAGSGCEEPPAPYRLRAVGNEPFWSATVTADSVIFMQPDEPARIAFPAGLPALCPGRIVYQVETRSPEPHTFRLTFRAGRCIDSMSGAIYSLSAQAVLDGRPLSGCAREGDLRSP